MTKAEILDVIRRIAGENGGKAPGAQRLESEVGLRKSDWYPEFWVRWSDAIREAGLEPNKFTVAIADDVLLRKYAELAHDLGRFPIESDLIMRSRRDDTFPDRSVLRRLGTKQERTRKVLEWCRREAAFEDVVGFCEAALATSSEAPPELSVSTDGLGFVYLVKHGNRAEYKIGRTSNPVRREGEVRLELPEKVAPVHYIKTDDPAGVESYWHRRFDHKRKEGEWFALNAADVRAFKRWKRIF